MTGRWESLRARYRSLFPQWARERGYVAVMTAFLMITLMGLAAFAVDVGNWYMVGQQEQSAADAAVMAGVTYLPADPISAASIAKSYSQANHFQDGVNSTTVTSQLDGATRLRVSVDRTVTNFFGSLLGMPTTKVGRTAVADFAGPVKMGSPCNRLGNNPDPSVGGVSTEATACSGVSGAFWASVSGPKTGKVNGDAYQSITCASTVDGCSGSSAGPNIDYTSNGYYYTVSVKQAMTTLNIELFDPVFVHTGLTCSDSGSPDVFDESGEKAVEAHNPIVSDESTRYAPGSSSAYCTGDSILGSLSSAQDMVTQFTVRAPGTSAWDPATFPVVSGCQKTYPGYYGVLKRMLDSGNTSTYNENNAGVVTNPSLVDGFRRWTTLCTITNPTVGDYLIQVKTNGLGFDNGDATNHFAMRAYGSASGDKDNVSISGREKMSIYANAPGAVTGFYLARVPTSAAGQTLRVKLFDVGDSASNGTIKIIPPDGTSYAGCVGQLGPGPSPAAGAQVALTNCTLTVSNASHNGKWQSVAVPIPSAYTCIDTDPTACWVKLQYTYGSGPNNDVTSWAASIEGDPVRLVE
jgi:Flp pilus assembly protein TadG